MPALYSVAWSWYSTTTPLVSPVAGMWSVLPWIVCRYCVDIVDIPRYVPDVVYLQHEVLDAAAPAHAEGHAGGELHAGSVQRPHVQYLHKYFSVHLHKYFCI